MTRNASRVSILALAAVIACFTFTTTVFAQFTITDLHNFNGSFDGSYPESAPIMDSAGNLYGVTTEGGAHNGGMAYELSPSSTGWIYTHIYDFTSGGTGAAAPSGGLIFDASGNLYGVSQNGGTGNLGVVYELSHSSSGWTQTVLYSFTGSSTAERPRGTTGSVFEISPQ
jgi:uncharacterized repeat protein (TIGR03803 family)